MGSYLFLVVLFVIQIPIIYVLLGGMSKKYLQEDMAWSLKMRAVEITEILNRRIVTGNESLRALFETKKKEYSGIIDGLRNGTKDVSAITDPEVLAKLDTVEEKWGEMRTALNEGAASGDKLNKSKAVVQQTTFPLVSRLNAVIAAEEAFDDPSITRHINVTGLQRMRTVKLSYLLERYVVSYSGKAAASEGIDQTIMDFDSTLAELMTMARGAASKGAKGARLLSAVEDVESLWQNRQLNIIESMEAGDTFHARSTELSETHTPAVVKAADELTKIFISKAQGSGTRGIIIMTVAVLISALISAFFMWATNSQIIRPITKIKETVERFAQGNLTGRTNVKVKLLGREFDDEITSLGASVDEMAAQMSEVIGRITDSSSLLASTAEQLSASSAQIEEGANLQSGQTAQAATAMEEMSATVIEVAKNAQQASKSSMDAQEIAANGGEVVKQAIEAMQEVSESTSITAETIGKLGDRSEEIGTIISVINDIADQTNLLALNAAIEAARAGEQGRGFAVVADEVRKLAERTTNATKEISSMINSIQIETTKAVEAMDEGANKVDKGVKLAHEAGTALGKIVTGVQNVTEMVGHIATSTEEQSSTTDEITRSMDSISNVSNSNVEVIGEVSKATGEMARLATELKDLVSNFRVAGRSSVTELDTARNARAREETKAA
jgi:methyl-accepting chemotaxis protein